MTYCYSFLYLLLWLPFGSTSLDIEKMPDPYSEPSIIKTKTTKYRFTNTDKEQITMNLAHIETNAQWHAAFNARREKLRWRLEQANHAEWNWPSTRARVVINKIENELDKLDEDEFVVPNFDTDESCALEGACV